MLYSFHMQIRNRGGCIILDSRALTKIQTIVLIATIVVAAVAGSAAYISMSVPAQSGENIRIGICGDLNMPLGKATLRGATLAAEQINAQGGILGRNITIVAEDDDSETSSSDISVSTNALIKLITIDKAEYILSSATGVTIAMPYQDICAENKRILFTVAAPLDNYTQRVLDNYNKYKYYFRAYPTNQTTISTGMLGDIIAVGNYTGFSKVALLFQDSGSGKATMSGLSKTLPSHGFQIVYSNLFIATTSDFSSYFTAIEAAGAEIVVPYTSGQAGTPLVKEWYERKSPTVVWGVLSSAGDSNFWNYTEGKCNTISFAGTPVVSGYPLTNKTLPTRDAFIQRWGEVPTGVGIGAFDTVRFILQNAIKRAGTTEAEAVIKTLETTNIETSMARHFVFTSSHDPLVGSDTPNNPSDDYMVQLIFQWQEGRQVPVRPFEIMKEAGATYKYPPWNGPWNNNQTP
jgi:branched-chain amino acid transport system substrate-binding protein